MISDARTYKRSVDNHDSHGGGFLSVEMQLIVIIHLSNVGAAQGMLSVNRH